MRVLLLQTQSPFDPTSGAAQSMRQIAQLLAATGASVRALSTTICEGPLPPELTPVELMTRAGATVQAQLRLRPTDAPRWLARLAGVSFELIGVAPADARRWEHVAGDYFNRRLARLTREFAPELVLTFGSDATDALRRQRLRAAGARVVFALHNLAYLHHQPAEVDAWLAPTEFLAERYRETWGVPIKVLPPPIDPAHALAASTEPVCVGFFNPEPAKGAALVAHLADRLARERPDVPLMIVAGRASAADFLALGQRLGFDLASAPNLLHAAPVARVGELLGVCRVVLMPSIVEEAAGRIPLEALANGVPVIASDRGGLPEMVGAAGVVLPLPSALTLTSPENVPAETVERWWQALLHILDDEIGWPQRRAAARAHAAKFTPDALGPRYAAWFRTQTRPPVDAV